MISYSILRDMNKNVLRDSVEKILTVNAKSQNNSNNNRRKKLWQDYLWLVLPA